MSPNISQIVSLRGTAPRTAFQWLVVLILVASLFLSPAQTAKADTIPTFSVTSVVTDSTVTIQTFNFPANQLFTVRMGAFGTLGIGGIVVDTTNSGAGGSFITTYTIPAALKGSDRIAIRMDSPQGFFSFNWFWNNTVATATPGPTTIPGTGFVGIPTFNIQGVVADQSVTILTNNFPASQTFTVRMGAFGTAAIGGIVVATIDSGAGGAFTATFTVPDALKGSQRIAIRLESPQGFFAFNWFWNNTTTTGNPTAVPTLTVTPGGPTVTPIPTSTTIPGTGFVGIPTFNIQGVVADQSVTILTNNFPANQTFTVRMGAFGTAAIGGIVVGTTDSGAGGAFNATYTVPAALVGSQRIAIRMDSPQGFFAFNWFWNNTTTTGNPTAVPTVAAATQTPGGPTATAVPATVTPVSTTIPGTGFVGIPTFNVQSVVQNQTVTILTNNFPASQSFTVRMGAFGTAGIGGIVVGTTDSGAGGAFNATYTIPAALQGSQRIAIRLESSAGFFAFNWFWNNNAP
jgi:hypothetical protein